MKLQSGISAIDFETQDIHGNKIKLSDFIGKKVILTFMRNVNCPFCNVRVNRLIGHSVRLQKSGVQMILFFESEKERLLKSVLHQGIAPFPIISDTQLKIYKQYGVESSVVKMLKTFVKSDIRKTMQEAKTLNVSAEKEKGVTNSLVPADFFINEQFKIVKAHYGKNIDDHVDLEELKKFAGLTY